MYVIFFAKGMFATYILFFGFKDFQNWVSLDRRAKEQLLTIQNFVANLFLSFPKEIVASIRKRVGMTKSLRELRDCVRNILMECSIGGFRRMEGEFKRVFQSSSLDHKQMVSLLFKPEFLWGDGKKFSLIGMKEWRPFLLNSSVIRNCFHHVNNGSSFSITKDFTPEIFEKEIEMLLSIDPSDEENHASLRKTSILTLLEDSATKFHVSHLIAKKIKSIASMVYKSSSELPSLFLNIHLVEVLTQLLMKMAPSDRCESVFRWMESNTNILFYPHCYFSTEEREALRAKAFSNMQQVMNLLNSEEKKKVIDFIFSDFERGIGIFIDASRAVHWKENIHKVLSLCFGTVGSSDPKLKEHLLDRLQNYLFLCRKNGSTVEGLKDFLEELPLTLEELKKICRYLDTKEKQLKLEEKKLALRHSDEDSFFWNPTNAFLSSFLGESFTESLRTRRAERGLGSFF